MKAEGFARVRPTGRPRQALAEHATRLYPDSSYLQGEWMRAIGVVRSTAKGWLLERRLQRATAS